MALESTDHKKMCLLWDEKTPEGLQKRLYHIIAVEKPQIFTEELGNTSQSTRKKNKEMLQ
jgi:hypothetical protein